MKSSQRLSSKLTEAPYILTPEAAPALPLPRPCPPLRPGFVLQTRAS